MQNINNMGMYNPTNSLNILNREKVVEVIGEENTQILENGHYDFSTSECEDGWVEFFTCWSFGEHDENTVTAYIYHKEEDIDGLEDMSNLDWSKPHHYTIY